MTLRAHNPKGDSAWSEAIEAVTLLEAEDIPAPEGVFVAGRWEPLESLEPSETFTVRGGQADALGALITFWNQVLHD